MLNIIMDYRMVPPLSALSLALCHEALEGGGNHKMESIAIHMVTISYRNHNLEIGD